MKLRVAWLADAEDQDSYSARETRVLLPALARKLGIVPLWFAVGSSRPPHFWHDVRVFPVPKEFMGCFLSNLVQQQRPQVVLSNLPSACLCQRQVSAEDDASWLHRINPEDRASDITAPGWTRIVGHGGSREADKTSCVVPYVHGLYPGLDKACDATLVAQRLCDVIMRTVATSGREPISNDERCIVMRQQLFCNTSLSQVMFELTNALLELGIPTVPQDEVPIFIGSYVHREEELLRSGAKEKYQRILRSVHRKYDPEKSITVHFVLFKAAQMYSHYGTFPSLSGREVAYATGNLAVTDQVLRLLGERFGMIFAPSNYVMARYFAAGLDRRLGVVIPHGVDPVSHSPESAPFRYETRGKFKFLQTSFPWVKEKGFDLTIKAFARAFTSRDPVSLILRIPRLRNEEDRRLRFGVLENLVREELAKPGSPEIVLLEMDVGPDQRAGIFTGADCYVHPLRVEGFGITILEAMACGLPTIATPWSGPADFLSPQWAYPLSHSAPISADAENGSSEILHVEPELEHLIYLMRYVFQNQDRARALGQKASTIVRSEWTYKRAAIKLASACGITAAPLTNRQIPISDQAAVSHSNFSRTK